MTLLGIALMIWIYFTAGIFDYHTKARHLVDIAAIVVFFYTLSVPSIIIHELGHAIGWRCVGAKYVTIRLGLTPYPKGVPWKFRLLGFDWEIYQFPWAGSARAFLTESKDYRKRVALAVALGPLATACCLIGYFLIETPSPDTPHTLLIAELMFCYINSLLFAGCMLPSKIFNKGIAPKNALPTDGLRLIRLLYTTDSEIEAQISLSRFTVECMQEEPFVKALKVEETIVRYQQNKSIITVAYLLDKMKASKDPKITDYIPVYLESDQVPLLRRQIFIEAYLNEYLRGEDVKGDPEILAHQMIALKATVTAHIRHGCVLVVLGRLEEGKATLLAHKAQATHPLDKTLASIFLSLADHKLGDHDASLIHATTAREIDKNSPYLIRLPDLSQPLSLQTMPTSEVTG